MSNFVLLYSGGSMLQGESEPIADLGARTTVYMTFNAQGI